MPKKTKTPKRKSPDALLKTSKKRDIELTEQELGKVSGGTHRNIQPSFVKIKYTTEG
jgi:hypothetical protein